jgi:ABC-type dipeptide/oligopeptide/nickel transport system ATPase component
MLALIKNLKIGVLFITHDLNLINKIAARTYVMYDGMIVDEIKECSLFEGGTHPFTRQLIEDCLCSK